VKGHKSKKLCEIISNLGVSIVRSQAREIAYIMMRITKKPSLTIRALIKLGIEVKLKKQPIQRRKRKKLDQPHIDYLCSPKTLRDWVHLSQDFQALALDNSLSHQAAT
jgi:hypothetical protein